MDLINSFLKSEVHLIVIIQKRFFKYEEFLGYFSTLFGSSIWFYLIPLLAAFHTKLYHRVLLSCIASDFINLILKWILSEDRPYWWIHETTTYTSLTRPTLYQTERTCETSPGSPSGHMMMAGCIMHLIFDELNFQIKRRANNDIKLRILNRMVFTSVLSLTAISRMYFAAHFLHQCIFGCGLGIFVSVLMTRGGFAVKLSRFTKLEWFKVALAMTLTTTLIFWLHKLISGNPMASVQLAFKYCEDPLHPKPETTTVFSAIRSVAFIIGISLNAPLDSGKKHEPTLDVRYSWILTVIIMIAQSLVISSTPKNYKIVVFYSYTFVVYAFFQFLFTYLIPKLCTSKLHVRIKEN